MANEQLQERKQNEKPMSIMTMIILTGFIGGILWSGIGWLANLFQFTDIPPNIILDPWTIGDWKKGWLGDIISILIIGLLSIVAAFIYYAAFQKFTHIIMGYIYGIILFLLVFFVLNPIFPGISPIHELGRNTIITSVCLYILYGVFVGYSISYEANEIRKQEEKNQEA